MIRKSKSIAVLAEIVGVLARHPGLRVAPVVEHDDGVVALTITLDSSGEDGLQVMSLCHELEFVASVATMRFIAREYGIDAEKLQALLPAMDADVPHAVRHLTVEEIDAVLAVLTETTGPADPPTGRDRLLDTAVVKLVALGRAMEAAI